MRSRNFATINKTASGVHTSPQVQLGDLFPLSHVGALNLRIDLLGAVHAVGSVIFMLQTSPDNINWVDVKAAATITGADSTWSVIRLNAVTDNTLLPMAHMGRIMVSMSNAGDTVSLTGIIVQE